jgi:AraC-like DNA-binding protein
MKLPPRAMARYAHSSLKPEEAERIINELNTLMHDSKYFADPAITINILASRLKTSRHHLSQVINERLHRSYIEYIGELRLEEARRKLRDPANLRYTIASLAFDSGFNTVSSFNDAFKKKFLITPSQYRDQALKAKSA